MADKKIKAVIFDFGETLVCFGRIKAIRLFWQGAKLAHDYIKSHGQPITSPWFFCMTNLLWLHKNLLISNITGKDFDALNLIRKVGTKNGVKLTDRQWEHVVWLFYEPLSKFAKAEPDIAQSLTSLKNMGLKLGIVSNTFVSNICLDRHLRELGIYELFDDIVYSYQYDFRKPDPRIFIKAADRISVRLPNIMFVGDRIDKDIKPAFHLCMTPVLKDAYTNKGKKLPDGAYKITHLSELPALIAGINSK